MTLLPVWLLLAASIVAAASGGAVLAGVPPAAGSHPLGVILTGTPTSTPVPVQCGTSINFAYAVGYAVGDNPQSVIAADFNSDGRLDLATANYMSSNVSVLLGSGSGGFQPAIYYSVGHFTGSVAAGDFNSDGHLDLAGVGAGDQVYLLLGDGNGAFGSPAYFAVAPQASSIAVGELNGDGDTDVVVGLSTGAGGIAVLLGNGDGSLQGSITYAAGHAMSVALADFNGDGHTDIATGNEDQDISVLLGDGDGTFGPPTDYLAEPYPRSLTIGDFNGDGHPDIAAGNIGAVHTAAVLLGNGDGTFQPTVYYPTGQNGIAVTSGDFNGDGHHDLVTAGWSYASWQGVSVLRGLGNGTFAPPIHFLTLGSPYSVARGDVNGDGRLDLVTASDSADNVSVLLNTCGTTPTPTTSRTPSPTITPAICMIIDFSPAVTYAVGQSPRAVEAGDFNGDGHPDLVTANYYSNNVSVMRNNGDGTLAPAVNFYVGSNLVDVTVSDFNEDGHSDIATGRWSGGYNVLLNNGDGNFHAGGSGLGGDALAVGDVNDDKHLDIVSVDDYDDDLVIVLGNGNGTFGPPTAFPAGEDPNSVALGDFNEDGHLDAVTANSLTPHGVGMLLGNGDGTFQSQTGYFTGAAPAVVVVSDFNEDGHLDVAATLPSASDIGVLLGNGDGTLQGAIPYPANYSNPLTIGDFDRDGHQDLAGAAFLGFQGVIVLKGDGDGTFGPPQSFPSAQSPSGIAVSDLNGDGKQDLAVPRSSYNALSVLMNSCPPVGSTPTPTRTATHTPTPTPSPTATPTACPQFNDVPPDSTFYPYVTCLVNRSIISGYADCTFRPDNHVTRGQLTKIVSNSAGFYNPPGAQQFEDVPPGSTFHEFVQRLGSRGIIAGYACGGPGELCVPPYNLPYFRPYAGATRGQLTKIVASAAGFYDTIPAAQYTFADVIPMHTFWVYVERLLLNRPGVMSGYPCGGVGEPCDAGNRPYFRPNNPLTRGQTSKIVANTFFPGCAP